MEKIGITLISFHAEIAEVQRKQKKETASPASL